jgi:Amt family ammonium transporter
MSAIVIGLIGGVLVVLAVTFIDRKLKVDDPVGAVSVHGVCGAWGTLAVGLFARDGGLLTTGSPDQLGIQALGVVVGFVWAFGLGLVMFFLIKKTIGLRVSEEEELRGLDVGEHGMEAYSGFQIFTTT